MDNEILYLILELLGPPNLFEQINWIVVDVVLCIA